MSVKRSFTPAIDQKVGDAGTFTTSAAAQVSAVNKVIVHGATGILAADQPLAEFTVHIETTTVKISANDELYEWIWQVSNSPTFASGIFEVARLVLGALEVLSGDADSPNAGHYRIHCTNEFGGTIYSHGRLYHQIGGTSPSIVVLDEWLD